jgi:soluble lytic murein transglycosylase-like protein
MMESEVVQVQMRRMGDRRRAPEPSRSGTIRTFAAATRGAMELIGFFCVAAAFALAVSPALRATASQYGSDLWADVGGVVGASATEEPEGALADEPRIGQPVVLNPAGNNAATYLARRYHVADDAVRVVVSAAQSAGKERQVDPLLILAVIAVESSMNPFAQSPVGATGLMQVMPDLHGGKFAEAQGPVRGALDPVSNIRVGSQILGDLIRRGGSIERGLQLYVGAGNASDDGGYANRVLGELARLRLAANGGVAAALAAAMRSDAHSNGESAEPMSSSLPAGQAPVAVTQPDPT